ncbi:16S rRNA (cytidine(1402)-2'-O)-methyltransferase [Thiotrichales bacterium 19S3-7]|nr:16S rRNA (cytidine(1402)-2'-O)-methyltransferase [Thiotrichales bacterium 19S3-7]MCF6802343.1 16S rRNA (cytidine(1402)-2'-O)-methyltransferase [Thiotrichales bacterium 19S3-11]
MIKEKKDGVLYVVATPIGNLNDITLRALDILKTVDVILAEDTRVTAKLLSHYGVSKRLISYHHHNEKKRLDEIENYLIKGQSIALVSDAGTPLISDPGYMIVNYLREKHYSVIPLPGASAVITAISASGLKTDQFQFVGFLSSKQKTKETQLSQIKTYVGTSILYESPHRLIETLKMIASLFGTHDQITLAKELTKQHEHFIKGSATEILDWINEDRLRLKGEFVILIESAVDEDKNTNSEFDQQVIDALKIMLKELPLKQAVAITAKLFNQKKNKLYNYALSLTNEKESS